MVFENCGLYNGALVFVNEDYLGAGIWIKADIVGECQILEDVFDNMSLKQYKKYNTILLESKVKDDTLIGKGQINIMLFVIVILMIILFVVI